MNCPSCNEKATSFLRNAFSLQGVSMSQSIKGYLKCENCGALLHIADYGRQFWSSVIGIVAVLALFGFSYESMIAILGIGATATIWLAILLMTTLIFTLVLLRFARVEKVEHDETSNASQEN
jgi:uncharacterized protein (DUF983 family)